MCWIMCHLVVNVCCQGFCWGTFQRSISPIWTWGRWLKVIEINFCFFSSHSFLLHVASHSVEDFSRQFLTVLMTVCLCCTGLVMLLQDPDPVVRRKAAEAMGRFHWNTHTHTQTFNNIHTFPVPFRFPLVQVSILTFVFTWISQHLNVTECVNN